MLPYGLIIYNILGILIQFPLNGLCLSLPSFNLAPFSSQQSVNRMHNPVTLPRHFPNKLSQSVPFTPSQFDKNNFATPQLTTVKNKNSASVLIPISSNDEQTSVAKNNSPLLSNKLSAGNDTKPLSVMTQKSNTDNIGAVSKSSANNNSPVLTLSPIKLLDSIIRLPLQMKQSSSNKNEASSSELEPTVAVSNNTYAAESKYKSSVGNNNAAVSVAEVSVIKGALISNSKPLSAGNGMKVGQLPPLLIADNSAVENSSEQSQHSSVNKNSARISVKSLGILPKAQPQIEEYSTPKSSQMFPNMKPFKALPKMEFSKSSQKYPETADNGPPLPTSPGRLSDPTVLPRYFPAHNSSMNSVKKTAYFASRPAILTNPTPSWLNFIHSTNSEKLNPENLPQRPGAPTIKENSMASNQISVRKSSASEASIRESVKRSLENNSNDRQPPPSNGNTKTTEMENPTINSIQKPSTPPSALLNEASVKTVQLPTDSMKRSLVQPNPSDVSSIQAEPSANLARNSLSQPKALPPKNSLSAVPAQQPLSKSSAAKISSSLIQPQDSTLRQHLSNPPVKFGPEKSLSVKSISLNSFRLPKLVTLNQTLSSERLKLPKIVTLDKPIPFPRSFSTPKSKTQQESLSPPKQKQLPKSIVQSEPIRQSKQEYLPGTDKSISNPYLRLPDLITMQSYPPAKSFKIKTSLPRYIPRPKPKPSSYSPPKQVPISLPSHSIERPGLPLRESLKLPDLITMQSYPPAKSFKIKTEFPTHKHVQEPKPKATSYSQPKPVPESLPSNSIKKRRPMFETPGLSSIHIPPINSHLHDPTVLSRFPPPHNITEKPKFASLSLSSKMNQKAISDMSKPKPSSYSPPKQVPISLQSHSIERRSMLERPGLPLRESLKLPDLITMQSYPPAKSFKIKTKHIRKPKPKASSNSHSKPVPESLPSNSIKERRPMFEKPGVPSIHIPPISSHLHDPTVLSRFPPPHNITEDPKFASLSLSSKMNQKAISDMSKLMWSNETSFEIPSLLSFLDSATVGVKDKPTVRGPTLPDSFFQSLPSIPSIQSIESQTSCPPCPETAVGFKPFCAMPTSGSLSHNSVLKFPNECLFKLYNCKNPDKQYRQVPTCNLSKSMSKTMSMRPF